MHWERVDKKAAAGNLNAYDDLIKFGANIIQTDQPALVKKYLAVERNVL